MLGYHNGIGHFTRGQRRGLGLGGGHQDSEPLYVVRIEADRRRVVVGPRSALAVTMLRLTEVYWLAPIGNREIAVKLRSSMSPIAGHVIEQDGRVMVMLADSVYGIAPGQACVVYRGNRLLGGGIIETTAADFDGLTSICLSWELRL